MSEGECSARDERRGLIRGIATGERFSGRVPRRHVSRRDIAQNLQAARPESQQLDPQRRWQIRQLQCPATLLHRCRRRVLQEENANAETGLGLGRGVQICRSSRDQLLRLGSVTSTNQGTMESARR